MRLIYVIRRIGAFFATIVLAATLIFVLARLSPTDPIQTLLATMSQRGRIVEGGEELVEVYTQRFGLDEPLHIQYINYMESVLLHGDLGYSLSYFPSTVSSVILRSLPWTIGLFLLSTLLAFVVGNILGALSAWPNVPKGFHYLIYGLMPASAMPFYLLALILIYLFSIEFNLFPVGGTLTAGSVRNFDLPTLLDLLKHATLPALSIMLSVIGFWALTMRGTMIMVRGEDFLTYAKAKGLKDRRIFARYAMRNAMLPQVTTLAIDLGRVVSGQVLVEIIFSYPGIGWVLYSALKFSDYFLIQGVVMFLIVSVALATLVLDLVYPLLDPRIQYQEAAR